MKKNWMVLPVVLLAVFGLMFLGCGGDDGGGGTPPPETEYWTVTFDAGAGTIASTTVQVEKDTPLTGKTPAVTPNAGFSFQYWSATAGGTEYDLTANVTAAITLYAVYARNTTDYWFVEFWVKEAYEDDYGTATPGKLFAEQAVAKNPATGTATKPTTNPESVEDTDEAVWVFADWYTQKVPNTDTDTPYDFTTAVSANVTLYAYYEEAFVTIKIDGTETRVEMEGVSSDIEVIEGGYSWERKVNYESSYAFFKVDLDSKKLSDFATFKVTINGLQGDTGYKNPVLLVSKTAFTGSLNTVLASATYNKPAGSGSSWSAGPQIGASDPYPADVTFNIWRAKTGADTLTGEVYFCVFINGEAAGQTTYEFTDIELTSTTDPIYDAVQAITITSDRVYAKDGLTLDASVWPVFATYNTIAWSEDETEDSDVDFTVDATTGVIAITDGDNVEEAGTIYVKATITNGATASTPYEYTFPITVKPGNAPTQATVMVGAESKKVTVKGNGTVSYIDYDTNVGYQYVWNNSGNWGTVYTWFQLTLETGKSISDYASFVIDFQGIAGDCNYKPFNVAVSASEPAGGYYDTTNGSSPNFVAAAPINIGTVGEGKGLQTNATVAIDSSRASVSGVTGNTIWVLFYTHMEKDIIYNISNIKLTPKVGP